MDQPMIKGPHVRFKKLVQIAMKHSPSHRKSTSGTGRVISSDDTTKNSDAETGGVVQGRPDVLPSATPPLTVSMAEMNLASNNAVTKGDSGRHDQPDCGIRNSPANTTMSTPTHTSFTEGTPSYTASSPSCCSEVLASRPSSSCTAATGELVLRPTTDFGYELDVEEDSGGTALGSLSRQVNAAMVDLANKISDESMGQQQQES